jgi:transmembrane sensor
VNRIDHHIRISQLIAQEVNFGLDENEKHELYSWINESEENKQVYDRIRSQEGFLNWDEDFHQVNVEEGWKRFDEAVNPNRALSVFQTMLRYAAVVFVPLFLAGGSYYLYNDLINQPQQQFAELESRNPQVQLILADGRKMNLDGVKGIAFREKDGTRIENGEGNLKYQAGEEKGKSLYNTVEIPRGCEYELVLSDGTKVHLNAMSSLRFPVQFSEKIREVELCGEAYFDVTKDVKHPFVVNVLGTRVEVLGTSFNVKAYAGDEEVVTTLVEGSVKVQSSGFKAESMLLEPGQQAIVDGKTGDMDRCEVDVALFTSWKEGVFLFKNQRIEDIMKELARWYDLKVFYKNSVVKEYRFGGHFDKNSDISSIMEMFELTRKVEVSSNGKTIVISEK